jgi:hypothetical protein
MSDANANASSSPLPLAPPSSFGGKGCLKIALIGCGAVVVLFIIVIVAGGVWFNRNKDVLAGGAQEGARFGLVRDEAACFQEAQRRAAAATTMAQTVGVGPFMRSCLEYSKPTAGFCDNVPPPTSIGRTAAWQSERCGDNGYCKSIIQVVQTYCIDGRPKRQAADTLLMQSGGGTGGGAPATGRAAEDSAAQADSSSF